MGAFDEALADEAACAAMEAFETASRRHPRVGRTSIPRGFARALQELGVDNDPDLDVLREVEPLDQALLDGVAREACNRELPALAEALFAHARERTHETERAALTAHRALGLSIRALTVNNDRRAR